MCLFSKTAVYQVRLAVARWARGDSASLAKHNNSLGGRRKGESSPRLWSWVSFAFSFQMGQLRARRRPRWSSLRAPRTTSPWSLRVWIFLLLICTTATTAQEVRHSNVWIESERSTAKGCFFFFFFFFLQIWLEGSTEPPSPSHPRCRAYIWQTWCESTPPGACFVSAGDFSWWRCPIIHAGRVGTLKSP